MSRIVARVVVAEDLAVEAAEPGASPDPQKPPAVLEDREDPVASEAICRREEANRELLAAQQGVRSEKERQDRKDPDSSGRQR
jgi:hypothetical protein